VPRTHYVSEFLRLAVEDITKDGTFKSIRVTNPLDPVHQWKGELERSTNNTARSMEAVLRKNIRLLTTSKIQDSWMWEHTTTASLNALICWMYDNDVMQKRRDFRNYMKMDDIEEVQPSSLKKDITTTRATNSLIPRYKMLD
jgi:hypothetical protein